MNFFIGFFIFILGSIVGSFLNCVIYRLETNKSFLRGRSFCPRCHHQLGFWDLIPILSFVFLRGKCRYCGEEISLQYPIVEASTAIVFLAVFNFQFSGFNFPNLISLVYFWILACFLLIIFVYDLKHYIIPDKIVYPAIALVFIYRLFEVLNFLHWNLFRMSDLVEILRKINFPFLAGFSAASFFFLIWFVSQGKWMGFGDVKLAFLMGLFLGFPAILPALFFSFFVGAIIGLGLMITRRKGLKSRIPFGPFLVAGSFFALFLGESSIDWYFKLLGI